MTNFSIGQIVTRASILDGTVWTGTVVATDGDATLVRFKGGSTAFCPAGTLRAASADDVVLAHCQDCPTCLAAVGLDVEAGIAAMCHAGQLAWYQAETAHLDIMLS